MAILRSSRPVVVEMPPADEAWLAPLFHEPIAPCERACCCPARAVFSVVMAPTPERPHPAAVLLCAHHARVTRAGLVRPGLAVYDAQGLLVSFAGPAAPQPTTASSPLVRSRS